MEQITFMVDEQALIPIQGLVIGANFEETKAALNSKMAAYRSMVVTEEGISEAKADLAHVRKIKSKLDEARIAVKKAYSEPVAVFEAKCKELTAICEDAINNLNGQVKRFEDEAKARKIGELRNYFAEHTDDSLQGIVTFDSIYNPRWENKGYSLDEAKNDIMKHLMSAHNAVNMIIALNSEFEAELISEYARTHDLGMVQQKNTMLHEVKKARERQKAEQAERERRRREEAAYLAEATRRRLEEKQAETEEKPEPIPYQTEEIHEEPTKPVTDIEEEEPIIVLDFRVETTRTKLTALRNFLKVNNIKYGKVPDGN